MILSSPGPRAAGFWCGAGLCLALLVGCEDTVNPAPPAEDDTGTDTDTDEEEEPTPGDDMLSVQRWSASGDANGLLRVQIDVEPGTSSFMLTGQSEVAWVGVEQVFDPNGDLALYWSDWWNGEESLTWAFYAYDQTTAFNWPIRAEDGPLIPGTWTVELWFSEEDEYDYLPNAPVDLTLHKKLDPDLTQGEVRVDVWYADGIDADPDVVAGVESAVARWAEVWAPHGLTLTPTWRSTSLDPDAGFTESGGEEVHALAEDLEEGQLVLIIADRIGGQTYYGLAGGIPGTLTPSPLSWTVVSWLAHAGVDGELQPDESRLMGETMAHELGHYMGLFHPVETNYESWDALGDTPACTDAESCEAQLGSNIMFPYSICTSSTCLPQGDLTEDQSQVLHLYTGTL